MSTTTKTAPKTRTERPKLHAVVLINDDFTDMGFVVHILTEVFGHAHAKAEAIMLDIHRKGKGVAGVYTHEVAETKAMVVETSARRLDFPLKAEVVPEDSSG